MNKKNDTSFMSCTKVFKLCLKYTETFLNPFHSDFVLPSLQVAHSEFFSKIAQMCTSISKNKETRDERVVLTEKI
jgi:hypothetical protein